MKNLLLLGLILFFASIDSIQQLIDFNLSIIQENRKMHDENHVLADSLHKSGYSKQAIQVLESDSKLAKQTDRYAKEVIEWKQQIDMIELQ